LVLKPNNDVRNKHPITAFGKVLRKVYSLFIRTTVYFLRQLKYVQGLNNLILSLYTKAAKRCSNFFIKVFIFFLQKEK